MEDQQEFKAVQIYGRLITKDNPKFDNLFDADLERAPIDKDDVVLPVFDVVFEDFESRPDSDLQGMIQSEIDESAMKNNSVAKLIHRTEPEQIIDQPPFGEPNTTAVPVGQIAVSPNHEGLISNFTFDNLSNILEERR
jgi:hypothetical protein